MEYYGNRGDYCGKKWEKFFLLGITEMFIGEYTYTIDSKRRIAIPSKFRPGLGKKAVITRGIDNCLVIYPLEEWKKLSQKLESLPASRSDARRFVRIMLSGAVDVLLDKLGRILVPDYLKEYAGLKKSVCLIGISNRIEIWDEQRWISYKKSAEKEVGNMAERLEELGI